MSLSLGISDAVTAQVLLRVPVFPLSQSLFLLSLIASTLIFPVLIFQSLSLAVIIMVPGLFPLVMMKMILVMIVCWSQRLLGREVVCPRD